MQWLTELPVVVQSVGLAVVFALIALVQTASDPEKPAGASQRYDELHARFGSLARQFKVLMLAGLGGMLLPGVELGYGRSIVLWAGTCALGMFGAPLLRVLWAKFRDPGFVISDFFTYLNQYAPRYMQGGWKFEAGAVVAAVIYGLICLFILVAGT